MFCSTMSKILVALAFLTGASAFVTQVAKGPKAAALQVAHHIFGDDCLIDKMNSLTLPPFTKSSQFFLCF